MDRFLVKAQRPEVCSQEMERLLDAFEELEHLQVSVYQQRSSQAPGWEQGNWSISISPELEHIASEGSGWSYLARPTLGGWLDFEWVIWLISNMRQVEGFVAMLDREAGRTPAESGVRRNVYANDPYGGRGPGQNTFVYVSGNTATSTPEKFLREFARMWNQDESKTRLEVESE